MKRNIIFCLTALITGLLLLSSITNSYALINFPFPCGPESGQSEISQFTFMVPCELVSPGDMILTRAQGACDQIVYYDVHTTGDCLPDGCSNISGDYPGEVIPVCDGTHKTLQDWGIIEWCLGESLNYIKTIKIADDQSPTFDCPQNMTVSTDLFTCCATAKLPDVIITDGCSWIKAISAIVTLFDPITGQQIGEETFEGSLTDFPGNDWSNPDTLGAFGFTTCLQLGTHIVLYQVEDDCGNTATCLFSLTVRDYAAPVAVCDEITTVAIGVDDPTDCYGPKGPNGNPAALDTCHFAGMTWVKASTFDDGSYDNCFGVKFSIRRSIPYSNCILGLNAINGQPTCDDLFPDFPSEFERAISEADSIKFYSCEVGTIQPLILRVYQLNSDGNISIGSNGIPIFNECIIQVAVEDKIKPVCLAPQNATVTCEQFDPSLLSYGSASVFDNCCLDVMKHYGGQCGLTHTATYADFDTACSKGTIVRMFQAFDCNGNSSPCSQQIVVNYAQDYYIRFPDDLNLTSCPPGLDFGAPTLFGEDCELLGISYEDEIITVVPDACYRIERNWSVINWCTYDPMAPTTNVPNPNPNALANHPSNLPGPTVSVCSAQAPWDPTIVKINPSDTAATNYCNFWSANANGYKYKQHIKIVDVVAPVIANCPANPTIATDTTSNDPTLWHNIFNPPLPAQDLTELETDLSITSMDDCSGGNLGARFLLFLDLDNDGTMESVLNSTNLPGADTIRYNNINTPGYLGGTPVTFDSRSVPTNQKWHFSIQNSSSATQATTALRWNNALGPNTFVVPQLPQGTHKIRWFVPDNCGNEASCEHTFAIEQGPTSGIGGIEKDGFALYQNEPNPFRHHTNIGFRLPNAGEATLSVYDAGGRLLFGKTGYFGQGYNSVPLEGDWLHAPAVLYYKLESGPHLAWRKMVLVR